MLFFNYVCVNVCLCGGFLRETEGVAKEIETSKQVSASFGGPPHCRPPPFTADVETLSGL